MGIAGKQAVGPDRFRREAGIVPVIGRYLEILAVAQLIGAEAEDRGQFAFQGIRGDMAVYQVRDVAAYGKAQLSKIALVPLYQVGVGIAVGVAYGRGELRPEILFNPSAGQGQGVRELLVQGLFKLIGRSGIEPVQLYQVQKAGAGIRFDRSKSSSAQKGRPHTSPRQRLGRWENANRIKP